MERGQLVQFGGKKKEIARMIRREAGSGSSIPYLNPSTHPRPAQWRCRQQIVDSIRIGDVRRGVNQIGLADGVRVAGCLLQRACLQYVHVATGKQAMSGPGNGNR